MPYAAVQSSFYRAATNQRALAAGGKSSYTMGPGDRQHHDFGELMERRDPHGLSGHPAQACEASVGRTAASATSVRSHPTPTTGLRQDRQRQQRHYAGHDPAMMRERRGGAESGLCSQSATQGEAWRLRK